MSNNRVTVFTRVNILRAVLVFVVLAIVVCALVFAVTLYDNYFGEFDGNAQDDVGGKKTVEYNGQTYAFRNDIETFVLVGLDTFGKADQNDSYNNDKQADLITLFVLDNKNEKCYAIQINRDTMTEVPILGVTGQKVGTAVQQIALAHTYGNGGIDSCRNVAVAVSQLMCEMPIDNYASLTMDGVIFLNDLIGGVTLTAISDFTGVDSTIVEGQEVTLFGEHALNYVRTRHDGTNETRMERQRQYMNALYLQSAEYIKDNGEFSADTVLTLSEYTVTNGDVSDLADLFKKLSEYEFDGIRTLKGESVLGEKYMEFNCDEDALKALVVELCCSPQ